MWHACARHTLEEHFTGRDPKLRFLFDALVGLLRKNGPLRVVPGKSGIAFQVRMRFAGVFVRRNFLEAGFILPRRLDHPRIKKVITYSPRSFGHHLQIRSPDDLDDELAAWLRETYRVGQQAELLAGKRSPRSTPGDFSWSESFFPTRKRIPRAALPVGAGFSSPAPKRKPPNALSAPAPRPAWHCPRCGRAFSTRNQMHICSSATLEDALAGKTPEVAALFRKLVAAVRRFGPVQIVPQKTRVAFHHRKVFLGVRFLRDALECELALPRRVEHPRFLKILSVSPGAHYHYLRLSSPRDLDPQARAWLDEAFREGATD